MIWNKEIEQMPLDKLREIQSARLSRLVKYVYQNSDFYRAKLDREGLNPSEINGLEDIEKLPFTNKTDLRDSYPFGLFSTDVKRLSEVHVSSGTTGNPTVVGYTKEDLQLWATVVARCLCLAGAEQGDMLQVAYGYGLFTGGLGLHYGGIEMGLTVIPASSGNTQRQLKMMQDFKPRIIACTPSYALYMADEARKAGLDPAKSSWEIGIFGAEPWSDSMRDEIEESLGLIATDIYGLSEIIGPGVCQECTYKAGLHIFSDVFYPEIIDPATGRQLPPGEDGELVITTLTKVGIPLIRYRTRDIVSMDVSPCRCGRTSPRLSKIKGRTDDMMIIRGINVFPSQIEDVLLSIRGTQPHYQIIVDRAESGMDTIEIQVEVEQQMFSDEIKQLEALERQIKEKMDSVLSLGVKVRLVEPGTVARSEGKAKRVIDKRGQK
ncbi:Phenylacetate-coenzyme A ligase [Sedimentisphaera cyanobacteriorum]|uniref:Phenylacetate-coenzyme A ligase n=1 Tax=Sedimentisphaera cyanobacteriorum TaxID=1940790 RepID=A0A1Q2HPY8_9BACT|nr:phenylacetate--CoA ligase [Sedimentisphaera cyanobacteriorum]AQQ09316.1 Phenylacetate-coenzyme A ligase [Sedimentisphaera cyanobacteriorum]